MDSHIPGYMVSNLFKFSMKTLVIGLTLLIVASFARPVHKDVQVINKPVVNVTGFSDLPFSEENLMIVIEALGIRFKDVVVAQARLETGNFKSRSFRQGNNLFGMKVAKSRLTTACGSIYGHAKYTHWTMSVVDYALFQSTFARKIRTKDKYLRYLQRNYAEDVNYISKL